jgi:hypothetical protein
MMDRAPIKPRTLRSISGFMICSSEDHHQRDGQPIGTGLTRAMTGRFAVEPRQEHSLASRGLNCAEPFQFPLGERGHDMAQYASRDMSNGASRDLLASWQTVGSSVLL